MAPSTIRKAIGAVKDQTSISLAKVTGNIAPDLEVLVVKATTHDNEPADEKYLREILNLMTHSRNYVIACVAMVSKRLSKTRDWIVAIKVLILVHRLMADGNPIFGEEIMHMAMRGFRVLNMADFRDEAHSRSWDHTGFVRAYAMYLEEKLEFEVKEMMESREREGKFEEDEYGKRRRSYGDLSETSSTRTKKEMKTPMREMKPERVLTILDGLLKILARILYCKPKGSANDSRLVIVAMYQIVNESVEVYTSINEALDVILARFIDMEYQDASKCFDAYVTCSKMMHELIGFYNWCRDLGIARSCKFPDVKIITDESLAMFRSLVNDMKNRSQRLDKGIEIEPNMNEIKALPPPENYSPAEPAPLPVTKEPVQSKPQPKQVVMDDLVDLRDEGGSADERGNTMALALFSDPGPVKPDGSCEADWELALVETASNLSRQRAELAGGMDPLLLEGMYDHGTVNQHVGSVQVQGGSASSVALPSLEKTKTTMLALPAPDGTMKPVNGSVDPFAASLTIPPPGYVQVAEMERKQQLLVQEQQVWNQYAQDGMTGQLGLNRAAGDGSGYYGAAMVQPQPGAGYYYGPTL